jgi:hypothetical protein
VVFLLQFACATAILVGDQLGVGANVGPFSLFRVLRLTYWPVLGAIDGLSQVDFFPVEWFAPHFERGWVAKAIVVYGSVGGAFHAALAVIASLLWDTCRGRRRGEPETATRSGTSRKPQ